MFDVNIFILCKFSSRHLTWGTLGTVCGLFDVPGVGSLSTNIGRLKFQVDNLDFSSLVKIKDFFQVNICKPQGFSIDLKVFILFWYITYYHFRQFD